MKLGRGAGLLGCIELNGSKGALRELTGTDGVICHLGACFTPENAYPPQIVLCMTHGIVVSYHICIRIHILFIV